MKPEEYNEPRRKFIEDNALDVKNLDLLQTDKIHIRKIPVNLYGASRKPIES